MKTLGMMRSWLLAGVACAALVAPALAQDKSPIFFNVQLPANAKLEIDGYLTKSTGSFRSFETPAVEHGKKYSYTIKAVDGSKEVVKTITLTPGTKQVFDLSSDFAGATTAKPKNEIKLKDGFTHGPAKSGFVTFIHDGRLWIFKEDSRELADFTKNWDLAKHVVLPGMGPKGMTILAPDKSIATAFVLSQDGYEYVIEKKQGDAERLWVFKQNSKELTTFKKDGELAKHVIRINAGPMGMTIKAPDAETIDGYLKGVK